MSREWVIAAGIALIFHALLLFGLHLESAAVPLPVADTAVDVDLVAAAPAAAPPAPEVSPPPPPTPEPPPPVAPPSPTPEPAPVPEVTPLPETKPPPRPAAKPAHPSAPMPRTALAPTHSAAVPTGASGGTSSAVRARSNPKPPYPPEARRLGQQGRVLLEVEVGADGRAMSVAVKRSSGFPVLDHAAAEGVQHWTFEPARLGGLPVSSRADVPVNFSLAQ